MYRSAAWLRRTVSRPALVVPSLGHHREGSAMLRRTLRAGVPMARPATSRLPVVAARGAPGTKAARESRGGWNREAWSRPRTWYSSASEASAGNSSRRSPPGFARMVNDTPSFRARHWEKQQGWQNLLVPEVSRQPCASADSPEAPMPAPPASSKPEDPITPRAANASPSHAGTLSANPRPKQTQNAPRAQTRRS